MTLKEQIQEDIKSAMRAKEREKLTTLRAVMAEIQSMEISKQADLTDDDFITILNRMVGQRRESIEQFKAANRQDLVDVEEKELGFIEPYLPEQLSADEVKTIIQAVIAEVGAESVKDMGAVMGALRPKLHGKADMGEANKVVRELLA